MLIARGDCRVYIKNHMKIEVPVKPLLQGDYFGELALLTNTPRTATVKSSNYCTMACIDKPIFLDMCQCFQDIYIKLKEHALEYNDEWKQFKLKLLA